MHGEHFWEELVDFISNNELIVSLLVGEGSDVATFTKCRTHTTLRNSSSVARHANYFDFDAPSTLYSLLCRSSGFFWFLCWLRLPNLKSLLIVSFMLVPAHSSCLHVCFPLTEDVPSCCIVPVSSFSMISFL